MISSETFKEARNRFDDALDQNENICGNVTPSTSSTPESENKENDHEHDGNKKKTNLI